MDESPEKTFLTIDLKDLIIARKHDVLDDIISASTSTSWKHLDPSGCVGISLLVAMVISSLVGTVIPMFFHKIKIDLKETTVTHYNKKKCDLFGLAFCY